MRFDVSGARPRRPSSITQMRRFERPERSRLSKARAPLSGRRYGEPLLTFYDGGLITLT